MRRQGSTLGVLLYNVWRRKPKRLSVFFVSLVLCPVKSKDLFLVTWKEPFWFFGGMKDLEGRSQRVSHTCR